MPRYPIVRRDGVRVRLFTRNGHDWAARYLAIAAAATALHARSFLIDGEALVADAQGVASFNLLRGRARHAHAFVWALDLLELDGEDLRGLPLERRKDELKALLKRAVRLGLNEYAAGDKPAMFVQTCAMGIVSKRRSSPYRSGRSPHWLKAKNPESPAVRRHEAFQDWGRKARW